MAHADGQCGMVDDRLRVWAAVYVCEVIDTPPSVKYTVSDCFVDTQTTAEELLRGLTRADIDCLYSPAEVSERG